jgi:hypothetical protein
MVAYILCCFSLLLYLQMPLTVHVTCCDTNSKKLVSIDEGMNVFTAVRAKFAISDTDQILVQRKYEGDWLDLEEGDILQEGTRLCFHRKDVGLAEHQEREYFLFNFA